MRQRPRFYAIEFALALVVYLGIGLATPVGERVLSLVVWAASHERYEPALTRDAVGASCTGYTL